MKLAVAFAMLLLCVGCQGWALRNPAADFLSPEDPNKVLRNILQATGLESKEQVQSRQSDATAGTTTDVASKGAMAVVTETAVDGLTPATSETTTTSASVDVITSLVTDISTVPEKVTSTSLEDNKPTVTEIVPFVSTKSTISTTDVAFATNVAEVGTDKATDSITSTTAETITSNATSKTTEPITSPSTAVPTNAPTTSGSVTRGKLVSADEIINYFSSLAQSRYFLQLPNDKQIQQLELASAGFAGRINEVLDLMGYEKIFVFLNSLPMQSASEMIAFLLESFRRQNAAAP